VPFGFPFVTSLVEELVLLVPFLDLVIEVLTSFLKFLDLVMVLGIRDFVFLDVSFHLVTFLLPIVTFLFPHVTLLVKVFALERPVLDLVFVLTRKFMSMVVLLFPFVAFSLPLMEFSVVTLASLFVNVAFLLPFFDDVIMTFDAVFELLDSLHVDGDLAVGIVVLGLHLVVLLFPHVALLIHMLILVFPHGKLLCHVMELFLHVEKGVVLFLQSVVLLIKLLKMFSGLGKLVLSHGILVSVHVLELFVLLTLSSQSLDLDVEISSLLLFIKMLLLPHDNLLREGVFFCNMHTDGCFELDNSLFELLLHSFHEEFLIEIVTIVTAV